MSENIKTGLPNYRFDKDEFDLKEYAKVIIKRRRTVRNIVLLCVLISSILGLLIPQTYDIYAIVRIGNISGPIIPKKEALYEIRSREILGIVAEVFKLNSNVYDSDNTISAEEISDTDLIKIRVRYSDSVLSARICNAIADVFVNQKNEVYDKLIALLKEQITAVRTSKPLNKYNLQKLFLLQERLAKAKNFAVIERSSIPHFSFWLGLGYKIGVAAISGLMIGLLIIFMQEFLGNGHPIRKTG